MSDQDRENMNEEDEGPVQLTEDLPAGGLNHEDFQYPDHDPEVLQEEDEDDEEESVD